MYREKGNHIITQVIEHKAILDTCKRLEKYGYEVTYLPVAKDGRVDLDESEARHHRQDDPGHRSCTPTTRSARSSRSHEIGKIAKEKGVLFHTDARAGSGKIPVDVQKDNGHRSRSITAHKMYGPKGVRRALRAPAQAARATRRAD